MHTRVPNLEAVDRFKQRINYPKIVQHITDEKKVLMDWLRVLKKMKISSTSVWESYDLNSSVTSKNHAMISDFFENRKKNIMIYVHVFTNVSNRFVIEEAVLLTGYSSMVDIKKEYSKNGPGDFYLYYKRGEEGAGDKTAICAFKNVVLEINTSEDDVDVRPIAKHLVDLMSNSLVKNNEISGINYRILQSAQEVKTGDTFWVDVQFASKKEIDNYEFTLRGSSLPEGLKYVEKDESKYYLKAIQSGTYQFDMWVMDRRTLIVSAATFEVTVKN
ncbi:hypothetical protein MNBD_GAMMA10-2462 [hydrothermal vent metagenome]|uniref:Uncharacterized protein n=1 Tax=hydrothermal vent metagenome TaxID=652676 RepID=A0A3B0YFC5_9ZZZZ